jgi:WD40 repeat protein
MAHRGAVHAVKYSRYHEDLLATGGDDARVALITDSCLPDAQIAETSASPVGHASPSKAAIHHDYVRGLAWFAHRDPLASDRRRPLAQLATGSWDKTVRAWRSDAFAAQSLLERAL